MAKTKPENKESPENLRDFFFPAHDMTLQASSISEANIKLAKVLATKDKNND